MRAGVAGEVLKGCVRDAAVLADVLVGFLALEQDMLPLASEAVRTVIAQKCLGVGILRAATLAVDGSGLGGGCVCIGFVCRWG